MQNFMEPDMKIFLDLKEVRFGVWGLKTSLGQLETNGISLWFTKLMKLQNKALKVINFQSSDSPTGPLYQENKVLKISDFINYKNALFVRNTLKRENPQVFHEMFIMLNQNHTYNTRAATYYFLVLIFLK